MRAGDVILHAMAGKISWVQVEEVLGVSARTVRRMRARFAKHGIWGLHDQRRRVPSLKRADGVKVQEVLVLWRRYQGDHNDFSVRHLYGILKRDHGVTFSYSFVKNLVQSAGLAKRGRARGKHRKRRERRGCFGELLHLDGSRHEWLAHRPGEKQTMVVVVDDATGRLLYAQLWTAESTEAVMSALREVFVRYGLPQALYTDRASWAARTPKAGGPVDKSHPTQVARALERLGIEHILSYSPQARGRSERANGTIQRRLVPELRVAGIASVPEANRYLREKFLTAYDREFGRTAADPESGFVGVGQADLDEILCHEEDRTVGRDNTVVLDNVRLQIEPQPGRRSCTGLTVTVRRHLDGSHSIWRGTQRLGRYGRTGRLLPEGALPPRRRSGPGRAPSIATATAPAWKPGGQITC